MEKNIEISILLDFYGSLLGTNQRTALELYYNDDLSLSEAAQHMGISRQGVRDCVKRGETALFEYERKLGLAAKFDTMLKGLEQIKTDAENIGTFNSKIMRSMDVQNWAKDIVRIADELAE